MTRIQFYSDPQNQPRAREDVRIRQIGLFVHEDGRRVTFGLELTPFLERPCIDVDISSSSGRRAASLSVIETTTPNFSLVMHLRDEEPADPYTVRVAIYYTAPDTERVDVDEHYVDFDSREVGEHLYSF